MNLAVASSSKPSIVPSKERILVALTSQEQDMFLPGVNWEKSIGDFCNQANPCEFDATLWKQLLRDYRPTVVVSAWNTPAIPAAFVEASDSPLRYVCHLTGSVRHVVTRSFLERGGLLTNWGSLAGEAVAEHALLLALCALRNQPGWRPLITGEEKLPGATAVAQLRTRTLRGCRVGVHGFGYVARSLVRLLKPFNVKIDVFSPGVPRELMHAAGVTPCDSLIDLAMHSEVFFECEALNPRTTGSVNAPVLATLPQGSVFVNVGRGAVVDETALLAEARSGRITVALDVLIQDPVGADSPFVALRNAVLSPHVAGPTFDQFPLCGQQALENLSRYLRGEPLHHALTAEAYDRST